MQNEHTPGKWYLFYVGAGSSREEKAAKFLKQLLKASHVEEEISDIFLPKEETKTPDGKTKISNLYPGYIFLKIVNLPNVSAILHQVSKLRVGPSKDPYVPLEDHEIAGLMKIRYKPSTLKEDLFSDDDMVRITAGPFKEFSGKVIEVNSVKQAVKVLITIFGRETPVMLKFSEVEKTKQ
ncbi:MAG: Transcription antitermination protein nusG [Candidatus Woesebacteria bacterium GW2011_GWB1_39_12]|uniref:Transcription termination/antitermination protein NusG n=1 Tax=Candidatus Woesebacteria bacterium GW2011_GWB1_39_12 TaxID=1618574 RepID=A0A0G0M9V7_9BACT|nr:MAG: Transcription antitermination protein nusG [Candidatus Woesebacteria bacterium GW2011_GWB1_39_12]